MRRTQVMLPGVVVHAANRIINCIQCSSITSPMQLEISRMQNRQYILSMDSMRRGFVVAIRCKAILLDFHVRWSRKIQHFEKCGSDTNSNKAIRL